MKLSIQFIMQVWSIDHQWASSSLLFGHIGITAIVSWKTTEVVHLLLVNVELFSHHLFLLSQLLIFHHALITFHLGISFNLRVSYYLLVMLPEIRMPIGIFLITFHHLLMCNSVVDFALISVHGMYILLQGGQRNWALLQAFIPCFSFFIATQSFEYCLLVIHVQQIII